MERESFAAADGEWLDVSCDELLEVPRAASVV
jgi:hypothetical protein